LEFGWILISRDSSQIKIKKQTNRKKMKWYGTLYQWVDIEHMGVIAHIYIYIYIYIEREREREVLKTIRRKKVELRIQILPMFPNQIEKHEYHGSFSIYE
jgi:hypothetical protein